MCGFRGLHFFTPAWDAMDPFLDTRRLRDRPVTSDDPRPSQLAYGPTDSRRASSHLPGEGADLRRNAGGASRRPHRCRGKCFTSRAAAAPRDGLDRHALGWWFGRFPAGGAPPAGVDRRDVDASDRVKADLRILA